MADINVRNIGVTDDYVYDISLDGSVVNALGMNVNSNTDGFNFKKPSEFRYTDENPYVSSGKGRNSIKGKAYTNVDADVAEFEDLFLSEAYNGGVNKMGLGIDEYCDACIQFARKNYADLMPDGKMKKVGNTIKSRKMSGYLEKFIDEGVGMLLKGEGFKFISSYYDYIDKIYSYRIPIKDIASKGNIKKSIAEYIEDCSTLTKSGSKKSRQAWYELVIKNNVKVNISDTIYYINTGTRKAHSDVKRVTHYYSYDSLGEPIEVTKEVDKLYRSQDKTLPTKKTRVELLKEYYGKNAYDEDEIILNCKMVPREIIDSDEDVLCSDYEGLEYNVEKYIDQFNKRITPLLVCFAPSIRDRILVTNPKDRQFFTEEDARLVSGYPMKETDQDTYEGLMTPERKEVEFWVKEGKEPPYAKECGMDWKKIIHEYEEEVKSEGADYQEENEKYLSALEEITDEDVDAFYEEGKIPSCIASIVELGNDMCLHFKKIPSKTPSTGGYVFSDISKTFIERTAG